MSDDGTDERSLGERITVKRILAVAGFLLLLLIVVPFVIYAVPQVVGAEHSYVVLSGSMEPTISPGDIVVVDQTNPTDIEEGDIITFLREDADRPTTHRVVDIVEQNGNVAFETAGDNNDAADQGLVSPSQIQGKIPTVAGSLFVIPYAGHVILFAGTTLGFALLVLIPIVLLLANEIYTMVGSATASETESDSDSESVATANPADGSDATTGGDERPAVSGDAPVTYTDATTLPGTNGNSTTRTIVIEKTPARDADDSAVTFTLPELELAIVVLAGFLAYSGWIAYNTLTTVSFVVAGSVGAAFLLLSVLYVSGRLGSGDSEGAETTTETEVVIESSALRAQLAYGKEAADTLRTETGIGFTERLDAGKPIDPGTERLTADGSGQIESVDEGGSDDD